MWGSIIGGLLGSGNSSKGASSSVIPSSAGSNSGMGAMTFAPKPDYTLIVVAVVLGVVGRRQPEIGKRAFEPSGNGQILASHEI
jgi:hypothetical protein